MTKPEYIDPSESNWLRIAKASLLDRDPVDALNDAEALLSFAQERLSNVLSQAGALK